MRSSILICLASLMIITFSCGCSPGEGRKTVFTPAETNKNLVYIDSDLTIQIPCEHLSANKLTSGRTQVFAKFFNKQNRTAECQVKVKFKDDGGKIIDETSWMPLLLPRREVTQFEHTSLTTKAKDFVVLLREAKNK